MPRLCVFIFALSAACCRGLYAEFGSAGFDKLGADVMITVYTSMAKGRPMILFSFTQGVNRSFVTWYLLHVSGTYRRLSPSQIVRSFECEDRTTSKHVYPEQAYYIKFIR